MKDTLDQCEVSIGQIRAQDMSELREYEDDPPRLAREASRDMQFSLRKPASEWNGTDVNTRVILDSGNACAVVTTGMLRDLDAYTPGAEHFVRPILSEHKKIYQTFAGPFIPDKFIWLWYRCSVLNEPWTEKQFKVWDSDIPMVCFDSQHVIKAGWLNYPLGPKTEEDDNVFAPGFMNVYHAPATKGKLKLLRK